MDNVRANITVCLSDILQVCALSRHVIANKFEAVIKMVIVIVNKLPG